MPAMTNATVTRPRPKTKAKASPRQIRTYRSAVNYLDSLTNYERVRRAKYTTGNFGLARMTRLLAALDNPHRSFKSVHIAGTKGKGSTACMLAEMLRACNLKVGLYTSPHLLSVRERIVVNGEKIDERPFTKCVDAVAKIAVAAKVPEPTYFEVLTAAAFLHFKNEGVELAVIETGMGGRLDSTNVITPEAVGITSISYDHILQLGDSLELIAKEKAGIIKKGIPVVSAPQTAGVKEVLQQAAQEAQTTVRYSNDGVNFSYRFEFSRVAGRHARICLTTSNCKFEHLFVPLLGEHQATNCTVALGLLDVLKTRGFDIDDQQAAEGMSNVHLDGRMQMICEEPRILVDGAHNGASIDALMRAIGQHVTYDSMIVIFGCQKDKDITGMLRRLQIGADKMIFTSTGSPRSADPTELAAEYVETSGKMAQVGETVEDAMAIATSAITREDLICITGSFYLVAEALRKFSSKTM